MPLGNSITRGVGSTDNAGYRNDLAQMLDNEGILYNFVGSQQDGAGFDNDHEGHDGRTADWILERIGDYLNNNNPEIVVLHIGTNDITAGQSPEGIRGEIDAILTTIFNFDPGIKIVFSQLIPRTDGQNSNSSQLNVLLQILFHLKRTEGYKIFFAPMNDVFLCNPNWAADWMADAKHPNDAGYNVMAGVFFNLIMNAINFTDTQVTDNFERGTLGNVWAADPEFALLNGDLVNTALEDSWGYLAIYKGIMSAEMASMRWGNNASVDGTDLVGVALKLDSCDPSTANGYAITIRAQLGAVRLWAIENGTLVNPFIEQKTNTVPPPQAGDVLRVETSSDGSGHHFDVYINDQLNRRLTDPAFLHGNGSSLRSGLMFAGNTSNDVAEFSVKGGSDDLNAPAAADLSFVEAGPTSITVSWLAPGDDDNAGIASSYELRYSTSTITEANFDQATRVAGIGKPDSAGTLQSFVVTALVPGTNYDFALKTLDEAGNKSPLSNVVSAWTNPGNVFSDDFNRTDLGPDWTIENPVYQIVTDELANTSTNGSVWNMAVYNFRKNPIEVSFKWGVGADAVGIDQGGLAVMLDQPDVTASGYLVTRRPAANELRLWTITNGVIDVPPIQTKTPKLAAPQAGQEFKVALSSDENAHYFDVFVNGQFDSRLTDPNMLQGNGEGLYSGVMLAGNLNNNIDDFTILSPLSPPSDLMIVEGDGQVGTVGQELPIPLKIRLSDVSGIPVVGANVFFGVTSGGGSLNVAPLTNNLVIEAEFGDLTPPTTVAADGQASNNQYIIVPEGTGSQVGQAQYTINVSVPGDYVVWGRVINPDNESDSFFIQMDGGTVYHWDVGQGDRRLNWFWNRATHRGTGTMRRPELDPIIFNLTQGTHMLTIPNREDGTRLDQIVLTRDRSFVPSGIQGAGGVFTDANGDATANWTLGTTASMQTVEARFGALTPAEFTATAIPDAPADIAEVSGNNQTGDAGVALSDSFVVVVTDQYDNPISGIGVTFEVIEGGGTLSSELAVDSDSSGQASILLTLGLYSAVNRVRATVTGTSAEVIFTATATSGVASELVYVSGSNQTGTVARQLTEPLKVKVLDGQGSVISGYNVKFVVTQGDGSIVEPDTVKTDVDGFAQVNWILGNMAGVQKAQALAPALAGSPVEFTATGEADTAAFLAKASGDSLTGTINEILSEPFTVELTDQFGNKIANESVLFTVVEGGGRFQNSQQAVTVNTNSVGRASAILTLGPLAGQFNNKVQVEKAGVSGSPQFFVASAGAGPAARIVRISGNNQLGFTSQPLPEDFVVKVMDASNNPVSGHSVDFTVTEGGGTLNGNSDTTITSLSNASGLAFARLYLGPDAGELNNKVLASSENNQNPLNNSPIEFRASGKYSGTLVELVSGNNQSAVVTSVMADPLVIRILDGDSIPVQNMPVTFRVMGGGGSLDNPGQTEVTKITDGDGKASAVLTIGPSVGQDVNVVHALADDGFDPLTGSPVVFVATGVASNAVKMIIADGNNQVGVAGEALTTNVMVSVQDSLNNGVPDHPVTFRVVGQNGHLSAAGGNIQGGEQGNVITVNSDSVGMAQVSWVLGTEAGQNNNQLEVIATDGVNPLQNSPLIFDASANAGPTDPDVSVVVATSPAVADFNTVSNVTITLSDKYQNPISGKVVQIASTGSQNFIVQPQSPTDANGQTSGSIASTKAELKTISATNMTDAIQLNSTSQAEFVAGVAFRIDRSSGNNQTRNVGTVLENPLVVITTDFFNNLVSGVPVFFEVRSGNGAIVEEQPIISDANGEAAVHLTLDEEPGTNLIEAGSGDLNNSPVFFTATGVGGVPGRQGLRLQ
jgi:lysophospholipase L1-like esterase